MDDGGLCGRVEEGIVVTDDYFGEEEMKGEEGEVVPLWCWLLRK